MGGEDKEEGEEGEEEGEEEEGEEKRLREHDWICWGARERWWKLSELEVKGC